MTKIVIYAIAALVVAAGLWAAYAHVEGKGYALASAHYELQIASERAATAEALANEQRRQIIANEAAKKREAKAVAELERQEAENIELRRKHAVEAEQDPDAGRPAVGAGGVQRLNQIR